MAGSGPRAWLPKAVRGKNWLGGDRQLTGSTANSHSRPRAVVRGFKSTLYFFFPKISLLHQPQIVGSEVRERDLAGFLHDRGAHHPTTGGIQWRLEVAKVEAVTRKNGWLAIQMI